MAEKLNVYELRDDLWKVAEKEAKKRPNISKEELKQKLTEYFLSSKVLERLLPDETAKAIEKIIGAVTEITIKTLEIYLRGKGETRKRGPGRPKKKKKAKKAKARKKAKKKKAKKKPKKKAPKKKAEKKAKKAKKKAAPKKKKAKKKAAAS